MAALAGAAPSYAAEGGRSDVTHLYVTHRDSRNITVVGVDSTGSSNPVPPSAVPPPVATGAGPRGIVFAPSGRSAYVVNSAANTISAYAVGEGGALRPLSTVPTGGKFPMSVAIAPNGSALYVTNLLSGTLSAFVVNADGTPTRLGAPVRDTVANSRGLAVSADGRFLFVGHGFPDSSVTPVVTTFAIGRDGSLRAVGRPAAAGGGGTGMEVSPDGRFLYVTSTSTDAIFGYRIDPAGGLHPLPRSPFPVADFPEGSAMTADGRHLYVTSPGPDPAHPGDAVSAFTVGADGALTPVAGSPFAAGGRPVGLVATPDGHLYVANFDASTISAFAIARTGALREIPGSPVPSGGLHPGFQSIAVRPDSGPGR
ncbi:MAG TPA: beta-propeller fold lactonase family protein [Streptosporangiaceae bacterium]|nr:beta-propeller fold lactonase family protein [Streptosporangiaceae bacterium]